MKAAEIATSFDISTDFLLLSYIYPIMWVLVVVWVGWWAGGGLGGMVVVVGWGGGGSVV